MKFRMSSLALALAVTLGTTAAASIAESVEIVQYRIHADPTDSTSAVTHEITLELIPAEEDGNDIGYEVALVTIARLNAKGEETAVWKEEYPAMTTPDHLWWVTHADSSNRLPAEFAQPPLLSGEAESMTMGVDDLLYDVEGESEDPAYATLYSPATAQLSYTLQVISDEDPEVDEDDEPVEVLSSGETD